MKAIIDTGFNLLLVGGDLRHPLIGFVNSPVLSDELVGVSLYLEFHGLTHRASPICPFVRRFYFRLSYGLCRPIFELHRHTFGEYRSVHSYGRIVDQFLT